MGGGAFEASKSIPSISLLQVHLSSRFTNLKPSIQIEESFSFKLPHLLNPVNAGIKVLMKVHTSATCVIMCVSRITTNDTEEDIHNTETIKNSNYKHFMTICHVYYSLEQFYKITP